MYAPAMAPAGDESPAALYAPLAAPQLAPYVLAPRPAGLGFAPAWAPAGDESTAVTAAKAAAPDVAAPSPGGGILAPAFAPAGDDLGAVDVIAAAPGPSAVSHQLTFFVSCLKQQGQGKRGRDTAHTSQARGLMECSLPPPELLWYSRYGEKILAAV